MRRKGRNKKPLMTNPTRCIVILSSDEQHNEIKAEEAENRQLNRIREFTKQNNFIPVAIVRRGIMGRVVYNRYFSGAIECMRQGKAEAVVCVNMDIISYGIADAYYRVGLIKEAGFRIFTVDEKEPMMHLYMPPKKGVFTDED